MKTEKSSAMEPLLFTAKIFMGKAPGKVLAECALSALGSILTVVNSVWLLETLTAMILEERPLSDGIRVLGIVVAADILASVLQNFYDCRVKPASDLRIKRYLERIVMAHAKKLPLCHYENSEFYTTVRQVQGAVPDTVFAAYSDFVQTLGNAAALFGAAAAAAAISPGLLAYIAFTVPMIVVSRKYGGLLSEKKLELAFWTRKKQYAQEAWMTKELAGTFRITEAGKIADRHYEEGYEGSGRVHDRYRLFLFGWSLLGTECSITLIMVACYIYGIWASASASGFSASGFSVMFVAVMNMVSRIRKIYKSYENFCGYAVQLGALREFLKLPPEDARPEGLLPGPFETLEFRHVWFSYDGRRWALRDVSFRLEASEKLSVLGYNGAGKSTLVKLLLGLYPADRGEILYNGVNVNRYRLEAYREKFSAAFQEYRLFSLSLAENILMRECAAQEERKLREELVRMGREELAASLGRILGREYDGEGLVLSGGQRQQIAVSRLRFDDFEIAVLDEPSAALDPIASRRMLEELFRLTDGRSMLLISHDMSVARRADRILFMDGGRLEAWGTHEELMGRSRKYAAFYGSRAENVGR